MKRRYALLSIVLAFIILSSASLYAASSQEKITGKTTATCRYDSTCDKDGDYVMNRDAQCGDSYNYDCDDSDKDIFKECPNSLWSRLVGWVRKVGETRPNSIITGSAVKILPLTPIKIPSRSDAAVEEFPAPEDCFTVICLNKRMDEVYCPLSYDECCGKYTGCRIVKCDEEYCEQPEEDVPAAEENGACTEDYNDCYDNGVAVVCKGSFEQCSESFNGCVCGSSDGSAGEGQAAPDVDTEQEIECETGVFVCRKQTITISGEIADSKVTCKESFQRCSTLYGTCECGNSSLTDFPTKYIGSATAPGNDMGENDNNYWCDYKGRQVPCYMMPESCTKKKNTCYREDGIAVTCDGSFVYCSSKFNDNCLCGVETVNSGFMYTDSG
jgi:hypothetical protein